MRCGLLVSGLLALLLSGCATGQISLYDEDNSTYYPDQELRFAAADGRSVLTVIHGRAFDLPRDEFDQRVLAAMQGANAGTPVHFTMQPGPKDRTGYRVVLQFNGSPYDQSIALCRGGGTDTTGTALKTRLSAAFCIGRTMISAITGEVGGLTGPDDPRFRDLVRQVVFQLFAIRPEFEDSDGGWLFRLGP